MVCLCSRRFSAAMDRGVADSEEDPHTLVFMTSMTVSVMFSDLTDRLLDLKALAYSVDLI